MELGEIDEYNVGESIKIIIYIITKFEDLIL